MRVLVEPYGTAAFESLAGVLDEARGGDPFRRATVVAPRGPVALATRRRLAARPPGVLNVRCTTLAGLAGELAGEGPAAGGRRPVTRAAVQEAVRAALAGAGGGFLGAVRDQPATVRAVAQTYAELRGAPPGVLQALAAQSDRAAEVVRLVAGIHARLLDGWYDEADVVAAASASLAAGTAAADPGPVVAYLPRGLSPVEHGLLQALDRVVPVTVMVGATGDPVADGPARELVVRLGGGGEGGRADQPALSSPVAHGTAVVAAPTADAEVLLAVRHLMARNAEGVPLERMAVAHGGSAPYPRLVHDTLAAAGIPFNGAGIRPLAATVAGRALLGALALGDRDWRRDEVAGWLASAPLLDAAGRPVPGIAWDALSSRAGVVRGLAEWRERLPAHAATLRDRAGPVGGGDDGGEGDGLRRDAGRCEALAAFVDDLARRLASPPGTWAGWAGWARDLLRRLLGGPAHQSGWPPAEVAALDAVVEAVQGLGALGDRVPAPGEARAALAAELEALAPQPSRFGHGILVGRVAEMVGLDLDVLCVVGMVDGAFPGRPGDDALLPDREREAAGGQVPLRGARPPEDRHDFLAALAAAGERVLSFATGDQRRGREQRPARLLLDTAGVLAGAVGPVHAGDLERLGGHTRVPSYAATVAGPAGEPVSPDDWDLRALVRWAGAGRDPAHHFLAGSDPVLAAGYELRRGRRRRAFSRYDGRVDGVAAAVDPSIQSPTGLEAYARCPRRYLFGRLLHVAVRERPESALRIDPAERGSMVHRILERFVAGALAGGPPDPAVPWGPEGERRLLRIADEVFADAEQRGLTGPPALWAVDRAALVGELRQFLRDDDRYRREAGAAPVAVEQPFGGDGEAPVVVTVGPGRSVRFRGTVDRVDRTAGGGTVVLDYKTGSRPRSGAGDDPFAGGTRLQLVAYGLAARQRYGPGDPVDVRYWYVGGRGADRGRAPQEGFRLTPAEEAGFDAVVSALVAGVEGGRFPGNPAGCTVCPFTGICPPERERAREWERKRDDPWLAGYLALAEPTS